MARAIFKYPRKVDGKMFHKGVVYEVADDFADHPYVQGLLKAGDLTLSDSAPVVEDADASGDEAESKPKKKKAAQS